MEHFFLSALSVILIILGSYDHSSSAVGAQVTDFDFRITQVGPEQIMIGSRTLFCGGDCGQYREGFYGYPTQQVEHIIDTYNVSSDFFVQDDPTSERVTEFEQRTLCPSYARTVTPTYGKNQNEAWKLIINHPTREGYVQSVKVEYCSTGRSFVGTTCSNALAIGGFTPECVTKYMNRRLVSINGNARPEIDIFPLPSGCECVLHPYKTSRESRYMSPASNHMWDLLVGDRMLRANNQVKTEN